MKNPTNQPARAKLPRAYADRVSLDCLGQLFVEFDRKKFKRGQSIAIVPLDKGQARALCRFANRSDSIQVALLKAVFRREFLCFTMPENDAILTKGTRAVLAAVFGRASK